MKLVQLIYLYTETIFTNFRNYNLDFNNENLMFSKRKLN